MSKVVYSVIIADDHKIVLDGLIALINNVPYLEIAGTASNGTDAKNEILLLKPDIAILDITMKGLTGIQVMEALKGKVKTKFIVLSMHGNNNMMQLAKQAGAKGYLPKGMDNKELMQCIQQVLNNQLSFPDSFIESDTPAREPLSNREVEVLILIVKGKTNQEIAEVLQLSQHTVESHRKNIYRKLEAHNSSGLWQYAMEHGLDLQ